MKRIEIYSSKKKSFWLLLGSLAFVAISIWLLREVVNQTAWRARYPMYVRLIAIVSILFFGAGAIIAIKRLIKSKIALVIDSKGLNVEPKKSMTEFIPWSDINGFEEIKIQTTRIVIIGLNNPNDWLDKETNFIRRKMMQFNMNQYNSPFGIAAAGLDISSDQLIETLNTYFDRYKNEE